VIIQSINELVLFLPLCNQREAKQRTQIIIRQSSYQLAHKTAIAELSEKLVHSLNSLIDDYHLPHNPLRSTKSDKSSG